MIGELFMVNKVKRSSKTGLVHLSPPQDLDVCLSQTTLAPSPAKVINWPGVPMETPISVISRHLAYMQTHVRGDDAQRGVQSVLTTCSVSTSRPPLMLIDSRLADAAGY